METPEQWEQISPYAMRLAPWTVSKSNVLGAWRYLLWRDGQASPVSSHDSFDGARESAV